MSTLPTITVTLLAASSCVNSVLLYRLAKTVHLQGQRLDGRGAPIKVTIRRPERVLR